MIHSVRVRADPHTHVIYTAVGFVIGYFGHHYEETSEERMQRLLETHKRAPAEWGALLKGIHDKNNLGTPFAVLCTSSCGSPAYLGVSGRFL